MFLTTKTGRKVYLPTPEEEAQINAGIAADPDTFEPTAEEIATMRPYGRPKSPHPRKQSTTIRFDTDVLAALKATGKGWQTRVNEAMREWVKTHSSG
jgi:uncharacterized protein (DUF4415 family)